MCTERRYKLARAVDPIAPLLFRHYLRSASPNDRARIYRGKQGSIPTIPFQRDRYRRIRRKNSPSKSDFSMSERQRQRERERGRGEEEGFPGRAVSAAVRSFPWREGRVSLAFTALGVEGKGEVGARWGLGGGGRRDVDGLAALPGRRVAG